MLSGEQHSLFEEAVEIDFASIEQELERQARTKACPQARRPLPPRALPPELPHIEHRHEPDSCARRQCGADLVKIG